jgi:L-iditol 2-dehydrogenase
MKAALLEKPRHLRVVDEPLRTLEPGELLLRVDACGVCGTDVHIVDGTSRSRPPVILGHEYAGTVEDAGPGCSRGSIGAMVAVDPNISCGRCSYCRRGLVHLCAHLRALGVDRDGGMAQYSIVPESQVYPLPRGFPAQAAAFIEPVSCAVHGIDRSGIRVGDTAVILGSGTIGLIMLQLALAAGAAAVIAVEPLERKRALAASLGAACVIDPAAADPKSVVFDLTGVGADVVIECAGTPETARLALALARRGGTVEFFGVCAVGATFPIEPNAVYERELTIVGSYVNPHTFDRSIAVLNSGRVKVDAFQINTFSLDEVHEALRFQREGLTIKSIITPNI